MRQACGETEFLTQFPEEWDAQREKKKKEPRKSYIDLVWKNLKP